MREDVSEILGFYVLYLVTATVLWTVNDWPQLALAAFLTPPLIWLSLRDIHFLELPDTGTLAIGLIGFIYVTTTEPQAIFSHTTAAVLLCAFFWLIGDLYFRRTGQEGLGIGDAKLFGAGALVLGPWHLPELILLPSIGGIVMHSISHVQGRVGHSGIPFGPFIAYAIFVLSFLDPKFL